MPQVSILVPEVEFDLDKDVIKKIREIRSTGKKHFVVVVAEGVGGVEEIADRIEEATGIESRATILGHVQRGGNPTVRDRVMATQLGNAAVHLLSQGIGNRVMAYKAGEIVNYDIFEALQMKKPIDVDMLRVAHETSI